MKNEWKRILFQWICPLIVLFSVLAVLFADFSKTVNAGIASNFEQSMQNEVELYTEKLRQEIEKIHTVGEMICSIVSSGTGQPGEVKELLNLAVEQTEVYEALVFRPDGSAILHDGRVLLLNDANYYEWVSEATQFSYRYVSNDGITGIRGSFNDCSCGGTGTEDCDVLSRSEDPQHDQYEGCVWQCHIYNALR